jgi:UDP-2,4-diacetamido-2,4,6-trideoxy-beta-L-altropyranose hydrolase
MTILIRADASTSIGTGHVMRCLALAQAWQEANGQATFAMASEAPALEARLAAKGVDVVHLSAQPGSADDARQAAALARAKGATWIVVDGYHFGAEYQRALKDCDLHLLFVDDYGHASHYYADLVLNQNIYADESLYASREPGTRLLLGTRYAMLRREFWPWRGWRREIPQVAHKVLVTMGGSDPDNATLKAIQALQAPGLEAKIVVGPANPNLETLRRAVRDSGDRAQLLTTVDDMPGLMAWADLAVAAGGSTCWELAFMGVPSVVLVLAENQQAIAEELDRIGVALNLGWHGQVAPEHILRAVARLSASAGMRAKMARRGQELVDGEGADRVVMRLRGQKIRLRQVGEGDVRLIWEWANDPAVRAASFSSEPIPWEQHRQWFRAKLNDPDCVFYIAIDEEETPIGQVRYDVSGHEAVVSISLDVNFRGKGYGSAIIEFAARKLYRTVGAKLIHAYVKTDNEASISAFLKAGFKKMEPTTVCGQPVVHLALTG